MLLLLVDSLIILKHYARFGMKISQERPYWSSISQLEFSCIIYHIIFVFSMDWNGITPAVNKGVFPSGLMSSRAERVGVVRNRTSLISFRLCAFYYWALKRRSDDIAGGGSVGSGQPQTLRGLQMLHCSYASLPFACTPQSFTVVPGARETDRALCYAEAPIGCSSKEQPMEGSAAGRTANGRFRCCKNSQWEGSTIARKLHFCVDSPIVTTLSAVHTSLLMITWSP